VAIGQANTVLFNAVPPQQFSDAPPVIPINDVVACAFALVDGMTSGQPAMQNLNLDGDRGYGWVCWHFGAVGGAPVQD
jgi:hypothetical protein